MDGIDAATFESEAANSESFAEATALSMSPEGELTSDNIDITAVSDVVLTRMRRILVQLRRMTSSSVDIAYEVEFTCGSDQVANNTATEFLENLSTALSDGVFDALLHEYATNNSASSALLNATSDSFTYSPVFELVEDNSTDDEKTARSLGLAVEIAAGVLALLTITIIVCCVLQKCYRTVRRNDESVPIVEGDRALEMANGSNRA